MSARTIDAPPPQCRIACPLLRARRGCCRPAAAARFVEKNKDTLQPDLLALVRASRSAHIRTLYEKAAPADADARTKAKRVSSISFVSIATQFKLDLNA